MSTPPPPPRGPNLSLTPEQARLVETNRLKAKAKQREKEEARLTSSVRNGNQKRGLAAPTGPLKRDSRLGKYFEYDLSKMVNSKGGFLVEDGKEVDEESRRKEKGRERERARQNEEPGMFLDSELNAKCRECGSMDVDETYRRVFGCLVCKKCMNEKVEKYSLLTKTECKEDYLLTDGELRDEEVLKHLLKANPHKSTFANMMLYVRYQVEEFAWKKWGSAERLDEEYERRRKEKRKKRNRKFEEGLRELRRRTREGVWQRRKDEEHRHVYRGGNGQEVCEECGFTIEVEEM